MAAGREGADVTLPQAVSMKHSIPLKNPAHVRQNVATAHAHQLLSLRYRTPESQQTTAVHSEWPSAR